MKKFTTVSVLVVLFSFTCFSQITQVNNKGYVFALRDSIRVYSSILYQFNDVIKQNEKLYTGYLYKNDSAEFVKYTKNIDFSTPLTIMEIRWKKGTAFVFECDETTPKESFQGKNKTAFVKPSNESRNLTNNDVINFLKSDSSVYRPNKYYSLENNISDFEEKYSLVCDLKIMSDIFCKFYKLENPYTKMDKLLKNNIPLYLSGAEINKNIIGNPEVSVSVTNISKNDIDAFDIDVYCYNRYGQPVKKYSTGSNLCICTSQDIIYSGSKTSSTWILYGQELTTNVKVFLSKVHFTNGKTFVIPNKQLTKIEGKLE